MAQASSANFSRLAAGAALGLMAGLALPHARKAAIQAPSLAAGDWLAALTAEHRLVEKSFKLLLATTDRQAMRREMLLAKIAYALNKHAIEEENVIYPALAESGRAEQARHLTDEHGKAKAYLYDLRRISSKNPAWLVKAQAFWSDLEAHMREEENEVFPAFRDAQAADENATLTQMMNWEGFKAA